MMLQPIESQSCIESLSHIVQKAENHHIVAAIDFDDSSLNVIRVCRFVAAELHAGVTFVHAVPPQPGPEELGAALQLLEYEQQISRERLTTMLEKELSPQGVAFNVVLGLESPADLAVSTARTQKADLIVVGAHGRHGFMHMLSGSVAETVTRCSPCPVLILGPEFTLETNLMKTVLFATDLDRTGLGPAQYAGRIANNRYCRLYMLHVLRQKPSAEGREREWVEDNCREKLFKLLEPCDRESCRHEAMVAYGEPAQEILAAADTYAADLIVLGTGDHGPASDRMVGNTLTEVIRTARCPILCVGPEMGS